MKVTTLVISAGILAACGGGTGGGASASAGDIQVLHAVAWTAPGEVKSATIGLEIRNDGDAADTLVAVTSSAGAATLHVESPGSGMRPIPAIPLPRRMATRLGRGIHIMISEMNSQPAVGQELPLTLRFAGGAAIDLKVPVMRYSDALEILGQ